MRFGQFGLVFMLFAELLYLTLRFDSQALTGSPLIAAQLIGWAPYYLRLAITVTAVTLLFAGKHILPGMREAFDKTSRGSLLAPLLVHCVALLLFVRLSVIVFGNGFSSLAHPVAWTTAWFLAGAVTLAAWGFAFCPRQAWLTSVRQHRNRLCWGVGVGACAWMAGFITQTLWAPLARYTFAVVQWMLAAIYPTIVSKPGQLIIGTPAFRVAISPECSGYEGIGLIVAFLGVYLWLFRKELRFPGALLLLPLGAIAIWILNAVRIVALIVIGNSGWPDIARGGFHSQAGWLAFNALALGIVAMTVRGRYFAIEPDSRIQIRAGEGDEQTSAYLAPFMAILGVAMLTGALSAGFEWLYPVRVFAVCGVLWMFRKSYRDLTWTFSGSAIVIGSVAFAVWLALSPAGPSDKPGWPAALASMPWYWAAAWLFIRVVGYVVTVPVAEELAFRGFLTRRIIRAQFDTVPVGFFTWSSFLISSIVFGALHGTFWAAGTVAGMLFAAALYRRRSLGDAVLAHATANGFIAVYVLATGSWSVWS